MRYHVTSQSGESCRVISPTGKASGQMSYRAAALIAERLNVNLIQRVAQAMSDPN